MPERITVYTWVPAGRKFFYAHWVDPLTGKNRAQSTRQSTKREAERFAADLEDQLNSGRQRSTRLTWADLRQDYEQNCFPAQKEATRRKVRGTLDAVEAILNLKHVSELGPTDLLRFQRELRKRDISEWTVKGHLSIFRKVLRWAKRLDLIADVPEFPMPKVRHAKGRAPTGEEFERMKSVTVSVVGPDAAPSWNALLDGLWWSGLRLAEAVSLRWQPENLADMWIDLEASPPMFHISAGRDKTKDRIFPAALEFAELLMTVPKSKRKGFVFNPMPWGNSDRHERPSEERIGKTIAIIGEDAAVKVAERQLREARKQKIRIGEPGNRSWAWVESKALIKHATAHDLRRAFGFRWALRVLPPVLMELMRHESIQTTQQFYIGRNAGVAAREAWRAGEAAKSAVPIEVQVLPNTLPNTSNRSASKTL
jgi:integrase